VNSTLNPYLSFRDNAREAMEFYRSVFGGTLDISTFKEFGASQGPGDDDKVMHSQLTADSGITFMAADTPAGMEHRPGTTMSMSLSGDDDAELSGYFEKLSEGGTVHQPLAVAPWGDKFGMLTDRFGIDWMVNIAARAA
jgi:PhnB protein